MKLHDGPLVQWNDGAWQRGRVQLTENGCQVTDAGVAFTGAGGRFYLVRHSYTNELEMVIGDELQVQPEEHPA